MNLAFSDDDLRRLAEALAPLLLDRLGVDQERQEIVDDGYLAPDAAATYLGVSRKRIYDLTSMRVLVPDGRDGRTPLFTRETLDAYARCRPVGDLPSTKRKGGRGAAATAPGPAPEGVNL